jgi:hypothetical protein
VQRDADRGFRCDTGWSGNHPNRDISPCSRRRSPGALAHPGSRCCERKKAGKTGLLQELTLLGSAANGRSAALKTDKTHRPNWFRMNAPFDGLFIGELNGRQGKALRRLQANSSPGCMSSPAITVSLQWCTQSAGPNQPGGVRFWLAALSIILQYRGATL